MTYEYWPRSESSTPEVPDDQLTTANAVRSAIRAGLTGQLSVSELALVEPDPSSDELFTPASE